MQEAMIGQRASAVGLYDEAFSTSKVTAAVKGRGLEPRESSQAVHARKAASNPRVGRGVELVTLSR
ncbi:hypothetical protein GA0070608_5424 [Micromonospora peucetia]|uniref:Uncharacterized protein n=1 Tax=Micromonospora peucetia TaxID=47871 RepID=A0A1C6W3L6_9ACTN|nr:hypothetical protein GA0070608_5424 [Micromonospora peucetia]